MKETNAFAERLAELRASNGIYQKELAIYLNVSIGTISNYEKGVHQPDLTTLCLLADYFGVSTDYLLGRTSMPFETKANFENASSHSKRLKRLFERIAQLLPSDLAALELLVKLQNKYHIDVTLREKQ